MPDIIEIEIYETDKGDCPYIQWENNLEATVRAIVATRLNRIRLGNFGDTKAIAGVKGLFEFRIHCGSGYRIYYGKKGNRLVILLCAGDKRSQVRDIKKAEKYWLNYLREEV